MENTQPANKAEILSNEELKEILDTEYKCQDCNGTGEIILEERYDEIGKKYYRDVQKCQSCNGTGSTWKK